MMNRGKVHRMKAMWRSFPRGVIRRMTMKLRCRLSWQEDKENGRKGRKHGKPGEGGKKEPLRHNLQPRYDRQ